MAVELLGRDGIVKKNVVVHNFPSEALPISAGRSIFMHFYAGFSGHVCHRKQQIL